MTVTDILEVDKKRSKIYIDGEFAFVLYKGELRDYGIRHGSEISEDVYNSITGELLPKRATKRAMNILQKKDYTENQLREKLRDGYYSDEAIDAAIDYVKSFKYIDDDRYARDYICYQMNLRSRNRILQDLMRRGISKDKITDIMDEVYQGEGTDCELDQIQELLRKKKYDSETADYKEQQKIFAFLARKGYSTEAIKKAMGRLFT